MAKKDEWKYEPNQRGTFKPSKAQDRANKLAGMVGNQVVDTTKNIIKNSPAGIGVRTGLKVLSPIIDTISADAADTKSFVAGTKPLENQDPPTRKLATMPRQVKSSMSDNASISNDMNNDSTSNRKLYSINDFNPETFRQKATGFKAGVKYRTPTGLDITPGEGLDAVETLGLMRTPLNGGTRRRSNLEGKFAPGQSPREIYHRNFQADRDYNPGVSKATGSLANMNVGDASGFSESGQIARNQTRLLRALREQADYQNKIDLENISQAGQTSRANLANLGAMDRTMLQEAGNEQDRDIDRQELELEREGLGIDRMKAETDAAYKNYLLNNQDNDNALTSNQWMDQDRSYREVWNKRFDPAKGNASPNDYMDIDGTQPLDYRIGMYRDNPIAATKLYGPPDSKTKALIDLNMNPNIWAKYIAATPEQQAQILQNRIEQKGY